MPPNEHLGPEAERRLVLKWFGLDESIIKHLSDLDDAETEWRVLHEHKVFVEWSERRRDWILEQCLNGTEYEPVITNTIVHPHTAAVRGMTGERLG